MEKYKIIILVIFIVGVLFFIANSDSITQGTLHGLVNSISSDFPDYSVKRDQLLENIQLTKISIEKLRRNYIQTDKQKEKSIIKARILKESDRLISSYSQFYTLNMEKVKSILPKIDKLRQHSQKSSLNSSARLLKDSEFKTNMKNFYGKILSTTDNSGCNKLQKMSSIKAHNNEFFNQINTMDENKLCDIITKIDKCSDFLKSIYTKSEFAKQNLNSIRSRIRHKKENFATYKDFQKNR